MLRTLILALAHLTANVESGLLYPNDIYKDLQLDYQSVGQNVPQLGDTGYEVPEKSVSYSISANDYNYLKLYKNGQQDTVFKTRNANGEQAVTRNTICKKYIEDYNRVDSNQANIISTHTSIQGANIHNSPSLQPIVKTHIYFHIPPPEAEEKPVYIKPIQQPKKIYKILFIKAPSQYSYTYSSNVQDLLRNRHTNVKEKTLIYVLVKKAEPQPEVPNIENKSEHEVFYVKYKGNTNLPNQLKDSLGDAHADEVASVINSGDLQNQKS